MIPKGAKVLVIVTLLVIKSNIRRYLDENHNVTSASEFPEACHSYKGVKGVLALECQIENNDRNTDIKCKIKNITDYFNFEYHGHSCIVIGAFLISYQKIAMVLFIIGYKRKKNRTIRL